jgi:hypothetical protein
MKQITNDDHAVLTAFAKQYGRNWKSALRQMWATANYHDFNIHFGDDAQILHRLRNTHGPAWLVRFRLTELNWHPVKRKPARVTHHDFVDALDAAPEPWFANR